MIHCFFLKQSASLVVLLQNCWPVCLFLFKTKTIQQKKASTNLFIKLLFFVFPKCKKKLCLLFDLKRKKKEHRKPKTTLLGKGWGKEGKTSKAFLFGHVGKKKKFFFLTCLFFCFLWDIFFEPKVRWLKKRSLDVAKKVVRKKEKQNLNKKKKNKNT